MKFASHWDGYWEQQAFGRQQMTDLVLTFDDGRVWGSGNDSIGPFTFQGSYQGGIVRIIKQYLGRHQVAYDGHYTGEGTIEGRWSIGAESGLFAMKHRRVVVPPDTPIDEL